MNDQMEYIPEDWKKEPGIRKEFRVKKVERRIPFGLGLLIIMASAALIIWSMRQVSSPVGMAITGVVGLLGFIVAIGLVLLLWWLPLIIAVRRRHPQALGVGLLVGFFGWTLLGWVGALIWATWAGIAPTDTIGPPRNRTEAGE